MRRLGSKLGPILWQIPPSLRFDPVTLEAFLALLPRTTDAAADLATHHNEKVPHTWLERGPNQPLRHALEVRHASFVSPEFIRVLRRQGIALVVADTAGKWPFLEDTTADFIYVRLHGDSQLYVSGYTDAALREWARKVRIWHKGGQPSGARLAAPPAPTRAAGRDVFVYFDNDVKIRAPYDAMTLAHLLQLGPKPAAAPPIESIAEEPRTIWPIYPSTRPRARASWRPKSRSKPAKGAPRKGKKSSASPRTKSSPASP